MKKNAGRKGVWGCSGSGKTTRAKELLEERSRVIAFDPMDRDFRGRSFKRCASKLQVLKTIRDGWQDGFKIQIPTGFDKKTCLKIMAEFVPMLFDVMQPYADERRDMEGREITLMIDEGDLFIPNDRSGEEIQAHIDNLTRRGRHYGIETILASQRMAQVGTTFRGNCTEHYIFAQADHNDVKAALAILGPEHKKDLIGLKAHEYIHKSMQPGGGITKGRNRCNFR